MNIAVAINVKSDLEWMLFQCHLIDHEFLCTLHSFIKGEWIYVLMIIFLSILSTKNKLNVDDLCMKNAELYRYYGLLQNVMCRGSISTYKRWIVKVQTMVSILNPNKIKIFINQFCNTETMGF